MSPTQIQAVSIPISKRDFVLLSGRQRQYIAALFLAVMMTVLAGCGGPDLADPNQSTRVPTATATGAAPTAAVGRTTGAPCESGILRVKDLPAIEDRWRDGLSVAKGRAVAWQPDAVLIELGISCELFEAGFRWQATFFSRNAQAYYRADTTEVIPVNTDPEAIIALPESEIDFDGLAYVIRESSQIQEDGEEIITTLDVRVSTPLQPIGPPGVPTGAAIYHLALRTGGLVLELYVDTIDGRIYRFE
jgi:hypothetical protein